MKNSLAYAAGLFAVTFATPALAGEIGAPLVIGEGVTLDPILSARLRYE
jgi:hypothetical protein